MATSNSSGSTASSQQKKCVFGYWHLRGRSLPVRLLLEYTNEPYELRDYPIPDFATMKGTPIPDLLRRRCEAECKQEGAWFSEKYKLGLDFPNLPYLLVPGSHSDGIGSADLKISQTYAICRYIARKHKLDGSDERLRVHSDMLEQVYDEARNAHRMVVWPDSDYEPKKQMYLQHALPRTLCLMARYLNGKQFFLNTDKPMYADILLFDYFDVQQRYAPEVIAKFPNIVAFIARMRQVPAVEKFFREQPQFVTPVYPQLCCWSGAENENEDNKTKQASPQQQQPQVPASVSGSDKTQQCGVYNPCG